MSTRNLPRGAFDPCGEKGVVRDFLEGLAGASEEIPTAIHEADDMYRYNLRVLRDSAPCAAILYYAKGWQIFQTIQRAATCLYGNLGNTPKLLDFASGHGRVTRFLLRELQPDRIWITEIHEDALLFQRNYFGVQGFRSSPEPEKLECGSSFPLIVASSFFSHIPPALFPGWLAALLRCLEPHGLLLFSTLGAELSSDPALVAGAGSLYINESETSRLDREAYGTTYVSEDFVRAAVRQAGGENYTVSRFRRALCALQDLYLVAPNRVDPPNFQPIYLPWGDVDLYRLSSDRGLLQVAGWIRRVEEGNAPDRIELRVNNRVVDTARPRETLGGDYRWSFEIDSSPIAADAVLMAVARTSEGFENLVGLGTLGTHPPEAC